MREENADEDPDDEDVEADGGFGSADIFESDGIITMELKSRMDAMERVGWIRL